MVLGWALRNNRRIWRSGPARSASRRRRSIRSPKGGARQSTTLVVVATDSVLTKAQAKRLAVMAQSGLSRAIYPVHSPLDGDVVFAASTGRRPLANAMLGLTRARHARRQCHGPRHRPGRFCRRCVAIGRFRAELAGSIRPLVRRNFIGVANL